MGCFKVCIALICLLCFHLESIETGEAYSNCPKESLPCNNGECVSREKWCDEEKNCQDESDEAYCKKNHWWTRDPNHCENTHFLCKSGQCIPLVGECDGFEDCKDTSDEWNCGRDAYYDYDDYGDYIASKTTTVPIEATTKESSSASDGLGTDEFTTTMQSFHQVVTKDAPLPSSTISFYARRIEQENIQTDAPPSTKPSTTTPITFPLTDKTVTIQHTIPSKSLPVASSISLHQPTPPYQAGFHNGQIHFSSQAPAISHARHHPIIQQPSDTTQQSTQIRQQPYDPRKNPDQYQSQSPGSNSSMSQPTPQVGPSSYFTITGTTKNGFQIYRVSSRDGKRWREGYYNQDGFFEVLNTDQRQDRSAHLYDSVQQPNEPKIRPEQYPDYLSRKNFIQGLPIVQVRKANERENSATTNMAIPTKTTNCSDHDSSSAKQGLRSQRRKKGESKAEKRMESALNFLQIFAEKPEKDERSAFCELLCIQLREMDTDMRLVAMHEINSLIFRLKRADHGAVDG